MYSTEGNYQREETWLHTLYFEWEFRILGEQIFQVSVKNKTRRDWVSTVEKDLNLLGLSSFTMDETEDRKTFI